MSRTRALTILSGRFPAKRAFVTGAASGLGRATCGLLATDGWRLGLLDRSAEKLTRVSAALEAAGAAVHAYAGDVSDEAFVAHAVEDYGNRVGGLDLMVNNAGVAVAGAAEVTPPSDWRWIVDVNLLGVAWGTRAAIPQMRAAGRGLILNVASAAGFASGPRMAAYNATKAGVIALTETVAAELETTGVQATVAMPGFFRTSLLDTMRAPPADGELAQRLMQRASHDADDAAAALLLAAARGASHVVWPREYRLLWWLKRGFPGWFVRRAGRMGGRLAAQADRPRG
ncbi:MAG: SDR family NAD(P)-dependent oxidoreductase [Lysobacterales bacterium]|jgi:NADP-dependent 3-hydroxy acid dehydrogenase YdfG|nr:MAG: SDR family NAD(P)-dependent oxidoreductase [Xanthomonadales bacterium]